MTPDTYDLPQNEQEALAVGEPDVMDEQEQARQLAIFQSLSASIIARRKEAIDHRSNSGIEQEWIEDEEFYAGIDDGNRHEHANATTKPLAGGSSPLRRDRAYGSTVVPNITAPYVDAAAARIGDMLLPTDDRNFALDPTPIPDLGEAVQTLIEQSQGPTPPMAVPMPDGSMATIEEVDAKLKQTKAEAQRKAEKAQTRIDDWLVECDYHGELREVIDDCARVGSGVIKGPTPVRRKLNNWAQVGGDVALEMREVFEPESRRIECWDLFPDKDCGEDIHNGDYIFERDRLSATKLRDLKGQPGYLDDQIDKVLEQGPVKHTDAGKVDKRTERDKSDLFEVWYYYGIVKKEEIEAAGCECEDDAPVYAILTLVNDEIVRAAINPLDDGDFPYDLIPWKKRKGMPWGMGVAREIRTPQRMVTAATRNLMNNAGLSAGPQLVVRKSGLRPKDGKWEIRPNKIWEADDDADVSKAFAAVTFPMLIVELERIIQLGMKFAEDVTGLPMLLQGQQGKAPDTVGGLTILNNNANAVLRRIARLFDSKITEPHIRRYYDWLMEYGEDPNEKGDALVNARGSSALVERDIQTQEMIQVLQMSKDPAFGWSPKKAASEYLKSRRFDPAQFELSDEEKEALAQQQPPEPPVITAAKIRSESAEKIAGIRADVDLRTDASDTDRDMVYSQAEMARVQSEHQARMTELQLKRELAMLDYANKRGLNLDKVKADLAKTAMTLRTQKELAHVNTQAKQVAKPAFEPRGRAPNGQAFQR